MVNADKALPASAEVVVVGGGIIGSSVAYHLAKSGRQVCLVERKQVGSGASGANVGLVGLSNKIPVTRALLIWESAKIYAGLSAELGFDIEYRQPGGIMAFSTEAERAKAEKLLSAQLAMGLPHQILSADEVYRREPGLKRPILGALYSPLDGYLNPYRTTVAYARAAVRLGVRVVDHCAVEGIELAGGKVAAVITSRGRVATPVVVNAAGAWSPEVGKMIGLEVAVIPSRGQAMVTERSSRTLVEHVMYGTGVGTRQHASGGVVIGSEHEFVGYDTRLVPAKLAQFAREACISFPELRNMRVVRFWANLRPATPDEMPLLGAVGPAGHFLATGHYMTGVAMAPITGQLVAEMVNGLSPSLPIAECDPDRFRQSGRPITMAH